jgi:hypothetical protein
MWEFPVMRLAAVSLLLLCGVSVALAGGAQKAPQYACRPFAERYCKSVPMGEGRRIKCLNAHRTQLTPACRTNLDAALAIYAYGLKQQKLTQQWLAKEAAKEKAEASKKKDPVPPPNGTKAGGK